MLYSMFRKRGTIMGEAQLSFISESDYLAGEELPGLRHEYVRGEIFAMTGASDRWLAIVGIGEDNWCRPFNGAEEDYCIEFGWTPYSTENTPNTAPAATPAALFTIPGAPSDIGGGGGAGARQCVSMIVPEIAVKPLLTAHPWGYWKGRVHWRTPSTGQRTWIRHLEFQVWDVRPEPSSNPLNFIGVLPTIPVI
jgi:hypothetical protein